MKQKINNGELYELERIIIVTVLMQPERKFMQQKIIVSRTAKLCT